MASIKHFKFKGVQVQTDISYNLENIQRDEHRALETLKTFTWFVEQVGIYWYSFLKIDFRERKGEKEQERSDCCSTYLCIHWLIFVCVLTEDQTHHLGVLGWRSNQLSYLARMGIYWYSEYTSQCIIVLELWMPNWNIVAYLLGQILLSLLK